MSELTCKKCKEVFDVEYWIGKDDGNFVCADCCLKEAQVVPKCKSKKWVQYSQVKRLWKGFMTTFITFEDFYKTNDFRQKYWFERLKKTAWRVDKHIKKEVALKK